MTRPDQKIKRQVQLIYAAQPYLLLAALSKRPIFQSHFDFLPQRYFPLWQWDLTK